MLLLAIMVCTMMPIGALAAEDSVVVIEDDLKNAEALAMFEGYGCTPELKMVNGEIVGVTMGGATAANGYPFMLFGEADWEDYILEFTAHDMDRCGAVIRSTNAKNHIDGSGGIVIAYEGKSYAATPHLFSLYSNVHPTTGQVANPVTIKTGAAPDVKFTANPELKGEMRFQITARGKNITVNVTYTENGTQRTKTAIITADQYNKTAGQMGFRAVFKQVNGAASAGYFSDLKVTLLGDTATKYKNGGVLPETTPEEVTTEEPAVSDTQPAENTTADTEAHTTPVTEQNTDNGEGDGSSATWIIIAAVAAVAVIGTVIVLAKKKKK